MQQISLHLFCILQFYQIHWQEVVVIFYHLYDFLYIVCHQQTETVVLPHFQFGFPLFLFLDYNGYNFYRYV